MRRRPSLMKFDILKVMIKRCIFGREDCVTNTDLFEAVKFLAGSASKHYYKCIRELERSKFIQVERTESHINFVYLSPNYRSFFDLVYERKDLLLSMFSMEPSSIQEKITRENIEKFSSKAAELVLKDKLLEVLVCRYLSKTCDHVEVEYKYNGKLFDIIGVKDDQLYVVECKDLVDDNFKREIERFSEKIKALEDDEDFKPRFMASERFDIVPTFYTWNVTDQEIIKFCEEKGIQLKCFKKIIEDVEEKRIFTEDETEKIYPIFERNVSEE